MEHKESLMGHAFVQMQYRVLITRRRGIMYPIKKKKKNRLFDLKLEVSPTLTNVNEVMGKGEESYQAAKDGCLLKQHCSHDQANASLISALRNQIGGGKLHKFFFNWGGYDKAQVLS